MTAPLRPMNLGEILDRTFHIYRSRFFLYVVIAALPALAIGAIRIVSYLLEPSGPGPISLMNSVPRQESSEPGCFMETWNRFFDAFFGRYLSMSRPGISWQRCPPRTR